MAGEALQATGMPQNVILAVDAIGDALKLIGSSGALNACSTYAATARAGAAKRLEAAAALLDVDRMAETVIPRGSACYPGMLEDRLLAREFA